MEINWVACRDRVMYLHKNYMLTDENVISLE